MASLLALGFFRIALYKLFFSADCCRDGCLAWTSDGDNAVFACDSRKTTLWLGCYCVCLTQRDCKAQIGFIFILNGLIAEFFGLDVVRELHDGELIRAAIQDLDQFAVNGDLLGTFKAINSF